VRSIQNAVAALVRRAGITGSAVTAHSLRHTRDSRAVARAGRLAGSPPG
jgi:integrase